MCVTFFCLSPSSCPAIKLILGFNRDENTERQTLPLNPFAEDSNIYAGRDLISGGTWLGVNVHTGVLAILTNYDMEQTRMGRSRGQLVQHFLSSKFISPERKNQTDDIILEQLEKLAKEGHEYAAFNLTIINLRTNHAFYVCSERNPQINKPVKLESNKVQGICNGDIEDVWPKTALGMKLFGKVVENLDKLSEEQVLKEMERVMKDRTKFSQNDEDESSILIDPYYSKVLEAERRTKETLYLVVREEKEGLEVLLREVSYKGPQMEESSVLHRLRIVQ